jgi:peptidoglycan/LPS O-acetylase OafA/YrhL
VIIAICVIGSGVNVNPGHGVIVMFLFCFLLMAVIWQPAVLRHPILLFLGGISYPLYLVHNNIGSAIILACDNVNISRLLAIIFALSVSVVLATILHKYVEIPAMKKVRALYEKQC